MDKSGNGEVAVLFLILILLILGTPDFYSKEAKE